MSKTRDYEALLYWNGDEQQLDKIRSAKDDRAKWKLLMDALEETHMTDPIDFTVRHRSAMEARQVMAIEVDTQLGLLEAMLAAVRKALCGGIPPQCH